MLVFHIRRLRIIIHIHSTFLETWSRSKVNSSSLSQNMCKHRAANNVHKSVMFCKTVLTAMTYVAALINLYCSWCGYCSYRSCRCCCWCCSDCLVWSVIAYSSYLTCHSVVLPALLGIIILTVHNVIAVIVVVLALVATCYVHCYCWYSDCSCYYCLYVFFLRDA